MLDTDTITQEKKINKITIYNQAFVRYFQTFAQKSTRSEDLQSSDCRSCATDGPIAGRVYTELPNPLIAYRPGTLAALREKKSTR